MDWWEQVEVLRDVVVGVVEFCADANATVIRAMSVESLRKKYIV